MKALKIIIVAFIAVALFLLIVAALLPAGFEVERSIEIKAPVSYIYPYVSDFNKWIAWNPWSEMDKDATNIFSGPLGQPGARWNWDGKVVGKGSLTIQEVVPNKLVKSKLEFTSPHMMVSTNTVVIDSLLSSSRITWKIEGKLPYPVGRYMGLFFDKMMGPDFEKGLSNLKKICEN